MSTEGWAFFCWYRYYGAEAFDNGYMRPDHYAQLVWNNNGR